MLTVTIYNDKITISEEILEQFKAKCKEDKLPINIVLERFMQGYVAGNFKMEMQYSDNGK